jgi:hypothetical protein
MVVCACHLSFTGSVDRRMAVQAALGKKQDFVSKINKAKRAEGMAQVIDHLPSKSKALNNLNRK